MHLKLTLAYDGTGLVGWQRQLTGVSVQALLEDALADLEGAPVTVTGAGRTDAGVHAHAQVASVTLHSSLDPPTIVRALNSRLPQSVPVRSADAVDAAFHARRNATAKTYRYRIWNGRVLDPFERAYVWHIVGPPLDADAMHEGAGHLVGQHDFAAFQGAGSDVETTVRTIAMSRVTTASTDFGGPLICYEVTGNGFLRHMVRSIVGTLVVVGRGKKHASWVGDVLRSGDRSQAGRTAPPQGLFLVDVSYR